MLRLLKVRNIPLAAVLIVAVLLSNLFETVTGIVVIPGEGRIMQVLAEIMLLCIVADLLRLFVRFVPIHGGKRTKLGVAAIVMICSVALVVKVDSLTPEKIKFVSYSTPYKCESGEMFTIKQLSQEELQIVEDGKVVRTVHLADFPFESYNDGHFAYTFWDGHGQVQYTWNMDSVDGPRSTMCDDTVDLETAGKMDEITHARIWKIVKDSDAEPNYEKKILDNRFLSKGEPAYDGGQELTGYFKDERIQKIYYEVGLSYGMVTYLFYFDEGKLVYAYKEKDVFPPTQDGDGLDYEKLDFNYGAGYFYQNEKLLQTKSQGQERYAGEPEDLVVRAQKYSELLSKDGHTPRK